jgi:hypothetical protein
MEDVTELLQLILDELRKLNESMDAPVTNVNVQPDRLTQILDEHRLT